MQYTTLLHEPLASHPLFYQDFKDTFVCNTQLTRDESANGGELFYQDFKDTFVCNTQLGATIGKGNRCCFIRMSMNNLSAKVQKKYEICKFI